jgi:hypothetical protein
VRPITWSTSILLAVILAGSGVLSGGSSVIAQTSTNSAPTPSDRATYIGQADALCKTANARQQILVRRAQGLPTTKLPPILRKQAKIAAALATNLRKLRPPIGDRLTVRRFVRAVQKLSTYSLAVANAIATNRASAARTLAAKLRLARQRETLLARGYGYKICGSKAF